MPSQLLQRVQRLVNPRVARDVNRYSTTSGAADTPAHPAGFASNGAVMPTQNTTAHWALGIGSPIAHPRAVTIHGTSGWSSYASAMNSGELMKCLDTTWSWIVRPPPAPPLWMDNRGVGPQYTIDPNGTILPIIGPENLVGDPLKTYHNEAMNSFSLGVEQTDFGDNPHVNPDAPGNRFLTRLNQAAGVGPTTEDLAGMKLYMQLHPGGGAEDVNLIWVKLATYVGPGDVTNTHFTNWRNSLFTERDYRSLSKLCRYLAEAHGIPRNVPTLPYAVRQYDQADADVFRQLLLGDPICDQIAARLGLNVAVARAGGATWAAAYAQVPQMSTLALWKGFFGLPTVAGGGPRTPCFLGFLSHFINGGHPCPGPLFDWHRFARELGDWWWRPFDFAGTPRAPSSALRPYQQARGSTRLVDYYYDAVGTAADYATRAATATGPNGASYEQFFLPIDTPIYALANGVVVAARLSTTRSTTAGTGFLLTRHEVFTPDASGRITFDAAPTPVWTLVRYLTTATARVDQIGLGSPDWLNRLVIRLKECELAVAYHAAHPAPNTALQRGWAHQAIPPDPLTPAIVPPTSGALIERDAAAYRAFADDLVTGNVVLFPREVDGSATTVRTILGDFIGFPDGKGTGNGIQIEVFSRVPLAGLTGTQQRLSVQGDAWWPSATATARAETSPDLDLPPDGMVTTYPVERFLDWVNTMTWHHEWPKYGILDTSVTPHVPAAAPARPNSRTSF